VKEIWKPMVKLHLDWETRGVLDLPVVGIDNYSKHPDTDIWFGCYAFDDEPVGVWFPGEPCPARITTHIESGGVVAAHGAGFEEVINRRIAAVRYGWPVISFDQLDDTMARAYAMSLPASLENAAAAMGLAVQKDQAGRRLMLQMCRPKEIKPDGTILWWDDADRIARLVNYGKQDVVVERALDGRLLSLSTKERTVWCLDATINQRGVAVDTQTIHKAIEVVRNEQDRLNVEIRKATDNFVGFTTEVARITQWVRAKGVDIAGLTKADVLDALDLESLPDAVRSVLQLRREAGRSSVAKLRAFIDAASSDGRVRNTMQYHGAGTGRWAGRRIQPHNLPRPTMEQADIEAAIELLGEGARDKLDLLYGPPMDVVANCLRGMIVAAPGCELLVGDFSNVEGRVIAWLAGEEWKLQAFRDQDAGIGPEVYLVTAAKLHHTTPDQYTKKSPERQHGKVAELAGGFQGWIGAYRQMEKALGINLGMSDEQLETIAREWREAHPRIVNYWYALEAAALEAVTHAGAVYHAGPKGRQVKYRKAGSFLWCQLPSGRVLCYPYPKIIEIDTPWGDRKDSLTYMTVVSGGAKEKIIPDASASAKWQRVATYGGKLAENVTQAVARDLLAEAMLRVETLGLPIVMHVHDEIVCEIPETLPDAAWGVFEVAMAEVPDWAAGLPVAVEAWRGRRYRK
jgi:DNA polymerase